MKTIVATVLLLLAALALLATTLWLKGDPLGYRGRPGVIREVTGGVELRHVGRRPQKAQVLDWVETGSELRTAAYSLALIETPRGQIELLASSALLCPSGQTEASRVWQLRSGRAYVSVDHAEGLTFGSPGTTTEVALFPGRYVLSADGRGLLVGYCVEGTMMLHEGKDRPREIRSGQFFLASPMAPAVVDKPPPLELRAKVMPRTRTGELTTIRGSVTPGGRVFINGEMTYPETSGEFESALSPGARRAVLVAEGVSGKAERRVLTVSR